MSREPQLGVALHSMSRELRAGKYTVEELLGRAGDTGVGPAQELVGRGYANVDDDVARRFRRLVDDSRLTASYVGANVDLGRRRDRNMTDDQAVDSLAARIAAAQKLGSSSLCIQFGAGPDAIRRSEAETDVGSEALCFPWRAMHAKLRKSKHTRRCCGGTSLRRRRKSHRDAPAVWTDVHDAVAAVPRRRHGGDR